MFLLISIASPFLIYTSTSSVNNTGTIASNEVDSNELLVNMNGIWEPKLSLLQCILFIAMPLMSIIWFHNHQVMVHILEYLTYQHPNPLETLCGSCSIYLLFLAVFLLVFYRKYNVMRRYVM